MPDGSLALIGPRLKSWRQKRSMTLAELSEATGISSSTLSRLEAGKRAPNLELVVPIAHALRLELDDIVPRKAPDPRVTRTTRRSGETWYETLSPDTSPVQTYKVTFPANPAGITAVPDPKVHDGQEWLYVLSGHLRLVLGEQDLTLGPGEAAEFDTRVPHWLSATGAGPAEVLSIFSKEGKRIHLRARPSSTAGPDRS
ncbi:MULTISPECIES: helix-turn-helix domain-containing protein [unclassified Microbacterium]|uniref:helix-turn-helix domain-containing protein n=1 Tax=unclassified Microbacterium TaxID=2609290 RepID=UPI001BEC0DE2|nr:MULTISPECIES: XRE family transcriptional regulator [unclassified Microbacterium]MBT2483485.1 cupin domain-containing protein [Microbacterium sp. ISL-108]